MPKVEQVGRAAEGAVMTEGCGMWPVQTGLRMTPPLLKELLNIGIEDAMEDGILIIEWGEIAEKLLKKNYLKAHI